MLQFGAQMLIWCVFTNTPTPREDLSSRAPTVRSPVFVSLVWLKWYASWQLLSFTVNRLQVERCFHSQVVLGRHDWVSDNLIKTGRKIDNDPLVWETLSFSWNDFRVGDSSNEKNGTPCFQSWSMVATLPSGHLKKKSSETICVIGHRWIMIFALDNVSAVAV